MLLLMMLSLMGAKGNEVQVVHDGQVVSKESEKCIVASKLRAGVDKGTLVLGSPWLTSSKERLQAMQNVSAQDDPIAAMTRFFEKDGVTRLAPCTSARILEFSEIEIMAPEKHRASVARIRILEGEEIGREVWAMADCLLRPIPVVNPPLKADTLLKAAENLERAGKLAGAAEHYRRVVKEYPGSPQAVKSAARIKALSAAGK